jgi:hypothetical protein
LQFLDTQRRVNQQSEEAFRNKVRQITGMASATKARFSDDLDTLVAGQKLQNSNLVAVLLHRLR